MSVRKQKLAGVIFDMDGTLIESSTVIPDAYIACISARGGRICTTQEIIDAYSIGPPEAMLTALLGRPASPDDVADYHARLAAGAHSVTVYPGIREALRALRARVRLAVFTGASIQACLILLEATELAASFDAFVGADEVARPKPEPDGIELASRRLGVPIREAAYVGDAPNDLEAARRSGALAVAAAWGHLYRADEPADVVLDRPRDLLRLTRAS
jgi:HAD superfamily hydrolase (TIGR01509 family)